MYRLLQDRHTFEMFVDTLRRDENDTCIVQVLGVLSHTGRNDSHAVRMSLDIMATDRPETRDALYPVDTNTLRMYLNMMIAAHDLQPELYGIVYKLVHGVPIVDIFEVPPLGCPDMLIQWHTIMHANADATILERARTYNETSKSLRDNICYPFLRDQIQQDLTRIQEELFNEIYMSYLIMEKSEIHEIFSLLYVPISLQAIIQESTCNALPTCTSDDFLYVSIGVSLLVLIAVCCFYQFKQRSSMHP